MWKFRKWFNAGPREPLPLPEGAFDLLMPEFVADPNSFYKQMRAQRPLAEIKQGGYLLTRHTDIVAAFSNRDLGNRPSRFSVLSARNRGKYLAAEVAGNIPPFQDMPDHRLSRRALVSATLKTAKEQTPSVFSSAQDCVAQQPCGAVELISAIASPFALETGAALVGFEADLEELKRLSTAFFLLFAPIANMTEFQATNQELARARHLLSDALKQRRAEARGDVISRLIEFQRMEPELTDAQILDCALLVFADAVENIEAGIASLIHRFLTTPGFAEMHREVSVEHLVQEGLRLDTPAQTIPRVAKCDTEICGQMIAQGTPVLLALASANRDETVIPDPDTFNPLRDNSAISFGMGRHSCIGEHMGKTMIAAMVSALLERGVTLANPAEQISYHARIGHRWPNHLAIVLR
ncbi:cytochrome P450 [Pelagimonas varians]|uniref:Biotin biosynthesis cytochrome P450 n=1 Tax=Pelagimonas varians TaxID=696760 RepID=A0A238KT40_9RHOB|nr:cytochrome P450 [Pelagimonas varians]PYG32575.1 cytochrome P450 [Pelagimonas varians]SMX46004.1 Biotin biosynthesis cytochrome P450 [Pelagimonas varians]